jgi:drug/metabolite transporter (DMT)-like permease
MRFFIEHKGKEGDTANNFYNAITLNILYLTTLFAIGNTTHLLEGFIKSFATPWVGMHLLVMGIASFLSFLLPLQAMKRASLSSLQPLKIFEPIMAGVFFDHKSIPREILFALLLFLSGSIFGFITELHSSRSKHN